MKTKTRERLLWSPLTRPSHRRRSEGNERGRHRQQARRARANDFSQLVREQTLMGSSPSTAEGWNAGLVGRGRGRRPKRHRGRRPKRREARGSDGENTCLCVRGSKTRMKAYGQVQHASRRTGKFRAAGCRFIISLFSAPSSLIPTGARQAVSPMVQSVHANAICIDLGRQQSRAPRTRPCCRHLH
eukprot:scaffold2621_cov31-Tisochrysis_lutea.AAC.2